MLRDIVSAKPLSSYRLRIVFEDGIAGELNVKALIPFTGVFAPLEDPAYFRKVRVNRDIGTVCWPNGADLDPDVLYSIVTGKAVPGMETVGV